MLTFNCYNNEHQSSKLKWCDSEHCNAKPQILMRCDATRCDAVRPGATRCHAVPRGLCYGDEKTNSQCLSIMAAYVVISMSIAKQSLLLMRYDAVPRGATRCDAVFSMATRRLTFNVEVLWLHRPTFQHQLQHCRTKLSCGAARFLLRRRKDRH